MFTDVCGIITPATGTPVPNISTTNAEYRCPRCRGHFTRPRSVKDHFIRCVRRYGNPTGLRWLDHPTLEGSVHYFQHMPTVQEDEGEGEGGEDEGEEDEDEREGDENEREGNEDERESNNESNQSEREDEQDEVEDEDFDGQYVVDGSITQDLGYDDATGGEYQDDDGDSRMGYQESSTDADATA